MIMDINSMHLRSNSYNYRRKQQVLFPGVPIWCLSTIKHIKQAHRAPFVQRAVPSTNSLKPNQLHSMP